MSRVRLILATSMLSLPLPSFGQGWIQYVSMTDRFGMYVPGEPEVRDIAYPSEYGVVFPARLYLYEDGPNRYSVTVVDYHGALRVRSPMNVLIRDLAAGADLRISSGLIVVSDLNYRIP